jgi:hypothetical protein
VVPPKVFDTTAAFDRGARAGVASAFGGAAARGGGFGILLGKLLVESDPVEERLHLAIIDGRLRGVLRKRRGGAQAHGQHQDGGYQAQMRPSDPLLRHLLYFLARGDPACQRPFAARMPCPGKV